jgi:isocitrate/isopropylmalate dehydrogenase
MMLEHLRETDAAGRVRAALDTVLLAGQVRTADLGGTATTTAFAAEIVRVLEKG